MISDFRFRAVWVVMKSHSLGLQCTIHSDKLHQQVLAADFHADVPEQHEKMLGQSWDEIDRSCSSVLKCDLNGI